MHCFTWISILAQPIAFSLSVRASILTTPFAPNVVRRAPPANPSNYPYGPPFTNEMKYLGYRPGNNDDKLIAEKLHNGFEDMILMAKLGYDEADKKSAIFKRWFDEADAANVKNVFKKIMDPTTTLAYPLIKDYINVYYDFRNGAPCTSVPGLLAYTNIDAGYWHMCRPAGQSKPQNRDLRCADIDGYASRKMTSIGMLILHEITHWRKIGDAALGKHIEDKSRSGRGCFMLSKENKLVNAQNYAFLGAEAYFKLGNCPLADPPPGGISEDDIFEDAEFSDDDFKAPDSPPPSPPPPSPPPVDPKLDFTPGRCCFHLKETEVPCLPVTNNLVGTVTLVDDKKITIGETDKANGSPGVKIDVGSSYHLKSKLKNDLVITGEHHDDYVRFTIGELSWTSKSPNGGASCDVGGWDPRDGSSCVARFRIPAVNNMNCCFPCDKDT